MGKRSRYELNALWKIKHRLQNKYIEFRDYLRNYYSYNAKVCMSSPKRSICFSNVLMHSVLASRDTIASNELKLNYLSTAPKKNNGNSHHIRLLDSSEELVGAGSRGFVEVLLHIVSYLKQNGGLERSDWAVRCLRASCQCQSSIRLLCAYCSRSLLLR